MSRHSPAPAVVLQQPQSASELKAYHAFRYAWLRQPWNQPAEPTGTDDEARSDHLMALTREGEILACGRLVRHPTGRGQMRSMAVAPSARRHGLGLQILRRLEDYARGRGLTHIDVHARETALDFYRHAGYAVTGPGENLFGLIPHQRMVKAFPPGDYSHLGLQGRPATDADGPAVAALVFAALAEYGLAPEQDGIDQDLAQLQNAYQGGFFELLHTADSNLVATVAVRRINAEHGELRRMYLAPDWRGRGLGRACLGRALAWSRSAGLRQLELETAAVLKEAVALYRWVGFTPMSGNCEARRCDQRMALAL